MKRTIRVEMTQEMFVVLMAYVSNTRLGGRNEYENAVSDFAIKWKKQGSEAVINQILDDTGLERPAFRIEASEYDGIVFNVEFAG